MRRLVDAVLTNGQLVVVRTKAGAASTVARAIDDARLADVLGTIAGDDTIFVAPARARAAGAGATPAQAVRIDVVPPRARREPREGVPAFQSGRARRSRMPKAIVVEHTGGPETLRLVDVTVGEPGAGEIRLRQRAIGVNFIDVYHRSGLYKVPGLPFTPGMEAAGIVEAVGAGVSDVRPGDRVAYTGVLGAYAETRLVPAAKVVPLPDTISFEQAAAMMLKGLTAQYLLRQTVSLAGGDKILLHAAAGGVGLIACQWARHLGLDVIATAGGPDKCALARAAGATHVIDYRAEDFVARVKTITGGEGVKVVFDSVGADTFMRSLDCLRPFGMMVSFGQSSGPVPPFDIVTLSAKGSLYLTRPTIMTYIADRKRSLSMVRELFDIVTSGAVKIRVRPSYSLVDAARAHQDLEGRRTTGSSVLIP